MTAEAMRSLVLILLAAFVVWITASWATAEYGRSKGFAFFPLFVASVFLSPALVLLAIAISARDAWRDK